MSMASSAPDKKRTRLSGIFSKKERSPPLDNVQPESKLSSTNTNYTSAGDSAYASSDGPPSTRRGSNLMPLDNNGQIRGVDIDRNLTVNKATGDVLDEDTGEVVSTVTTTTTTTTTTTMKASGKNNHTKVEVSSSPVPIAQGTRARSTTPTIAEVHGDSVQSPQLASSGDHLHPDAAAVQPTIPNRSPHRTSPDMPDQEDNGLNSPFPNPNFSYPSRANVRDPASPGDRHLGPMSPMNTTPSLSNTFENWRSGSATQPGTFDNLKAAAIGLHGVGETLRGTLNNEIDHRFPRRDDEKNAAVHAKNQAVLDRGTQELHRFKETGVHPPPRDQHPAFRNQQQDTTGGGVSPIHPTGAAQRPWEAPDDDMNYVPASFSPESGGGAKEEKKGFRRLLRKRAG